MDGPVPIVIILIADTAMVVTLPVHFRFFYVLVAKQTKLDLDQTYRVLSLHLTGFNILFALIYCLELEPASHGAIPEFFQENFWWLGRIEMIRVCVVMSLLMTFHLLIAINRLTAIMKPTTNHLVWTWHRTTGICFTIWALVIVFSLPILFDFNCVKFYHSVSVFGTNATEYYFVGQFDNIYPKAALIYEAVLEVSKAAVYIAIVWKLRTFNKTALVSSAAINRGIYRMTFAAFINSIAGYLVLIFLGVYHIYAALNNGRRLMPMQYYSVIFRFLVTLNNVLTPWVMLISFKRLRFLFLGSFAPKDSGINSTHAEPTRIVKVGCAYSPEFNVIPSARRI